MPKTTKIKHNKNLKLDLKSSVIVYNKKFSCIFACAVIVQRTRTQLGHRAFSVCGTTTWNSLPRPIHCVLRTTINSSGGF